MSSISTTKKEQVIIKMTTLNVIKPILNLVNQTFISNGVSKIISKSW
jgi:hypothetical protein